MKCNTLNLLKGFFLVWTLCVYSCVGEGVSTAEPRKMKSEPVFGVWRASSIGDGGYHQRVLFSPSNPYRYYTYIDTAGIFRSDDAGETWRLIMARMTPRNTSYDIRSVWVDPRNENVLLAALSHENGLYRSADGGESWQGVLPKVNFYGNGPYKAQAGWAIASKPDNPDIILAATQGTGIYKSTDNGKTWIKKGLEGVYATQVLFDAKNPRNVWICAVAAKPKWGPAGDFQGGLFYSQDAGETWSKISENSPTKMVQDPRNADTFYGISSDVYQVCISYDRGKTWSNFTEGLVTNFEPVGPRESESRSRYTALEAGPDFILCGSRRGVIYRLQAGATRWEPVELQSVNFGDHQWKVADHPNEWPSDRWGRKNHYASAMSNVMVDPRDPKHWLFTDWYAIYQSWDSGHNWKVTTDGIESTAILWIRQDPTDPARVYLNMSDNGFFFSDDGGVKFQKSKTDFPSSNAKTTDFSPKLRDRIWATGNREGGVWAVNQLYVSNDRGQSWSRSSMKGLPTMVGAVHGDSAPPEVSRLDMVAVHPEVPDEIYLTVSGEAAPEKGGIYRSTDGGQNWVWFGQGLEGKTFSNFFWTRGNQIVVSPDGQMLLSGDLQRKTYRFDREQGKWVPIGLEVRNSEIRIAADWFKPGCFFLTASGKGVYRSEDGGLSWKLVYSYPGRLPAIQTDHAKPNRVVVALVDTVLYSADAGETWADLDPDRHLPCLPATGLAIVDNRVLMATHNCGAYWRDLPK